MLEEYKYKKPSVFHNIGYIPSHWKETRFKYRYKEVDNRSQSGNEEMLSVSHITGVTPRRFKNVNMFKAESNIGQKLCEPADVVVNTMWAWMAALGVSDYAGIVSPSYGVYRPMCKLTYNPKYLDHLLRIESYRVQYVKNSTGITSSRLRLYPDKFLNLKFICPPREEQDQIVRYLDWKMSQINKLINAKRQQIVLLEEKKITTISHVVTSGGDGWRDMRLGNLGSFRKGFGGSRADDDDDGVACIRYGDIYRSGSLLLKHPISRVNIQFANAYSRIHKSEVLFALSGETKAEIGQALMNNISEDSWCSGDTAIFTAGDEILPMFLVYALRCPHVVKQRASLAKGDIIVHISTGALRQLRIYVPPIEYQREIVERLNYQCGNIEKIKARLYNEITLLNEFHTLLNSDVITGKKDIRDVVVPEYGAVVRDFDVMNEMFEDNEYEE